MVSIIPEERLVAELEICGIRYLSRESGYRAQQVRRPAELLADLVQQPSSLVRTAAIVLLLAHPDYAAAVPAALEQLAPGDHFLLKIFYCAAVYLQQIYREELQRWGTGEWQPLPDLFSGELGIPAGLTPEERLIALGELHAEYTGITLNWQGTYDNAVRKWLRQLQVENKWSQSVNSNQPY